MKNNKTVEENIKLEVKITNWARQEWGLDDDDCLSASEAYEMLEAGIKHFREQALKQRDEEIAEKVKKIITKEIAIAHTEGQPTSRLTSLFVKLQALSAKQNIKDK